MKYLITAILACGVAGYFFMCTQNGEGLQIVSTVSGILLVVLLIVLRAKEGPFLRTYGENVCSLCQNRGRVYEITIGMTSHELVPSYVEVPCPKCGKGKI